MSVEIHWNPDALDDIKRLALAHVEREGKGFVEAVECPEHHEHPKLLRSGDELLVSGCCEKAVGMASEAAGMGRVNWRKLGL